MFESLNTDDAALEQPDMRWYLTAQVRHASAAILLLESLSCKRPFAAVYKLSRFTLVHCVLAHVLPVCSSLFDVGR